MGLLCQLSQNDIGELPVGRELSGEPTVDDESPKAIPNRGIPVKAVLVEFG